MKKKISLVLLLGLLSSCNAQAIEYNDYVSPTFDSSIGIVKNVEINNSIITYNAVDGASGYRFSFIDEKGKTLYKEYNFNKTSINCSLLGLEGNLTFEVAAIKDNKYGPTTKLYIELLTCFDKVEFEAEDYLYNFGTGKAESNFRNNSMAHRGAYVGGIDDCGQGIYINYLCPFDGTYNFDAYYITNEPIALNGVYVNGIKQATYVFDKKSEWGNISNFNTNIATVSISLKRGWNTISVMKEGDASNNYGSYAELDYFVLHGDERYYNRSDLEIEFGTKPDKYRLEAEMGSPRKKNIINVFECKNPAIIQDNTYKYSNGYLIGGLDNRYDGVEWQMFVDEETTYKIDIGYASDQDNAYATFYITQKEIALSHGADFLDMGGTRIDLGKYGWNNVKHLETDKTITLKPGKNFIYCLKMEPTPKKTSENPNPENICIFQLDYIDLIEVK